MGHVFGSRQAYRSHKYQMDYTLHVDPHHRVLLVTFGKIVTKASVLAAYTAIEQFMAAHGPHSGITDFSEVEKFDIKADFIWFLVTKPPAIPIDGPAKLWLAAQTFTA